MKHNSISSQGYLKEQSTEEKNVTFNVMKGSTSAIYYEAFYCIEKNIS